MIYLMMLCTTNEGSFKLNSNGRSELLVKHTKKTFFFFVRNEFPVILLNKYSTRTFHCSAIIFIVTVFDKMGILCVHTACVKGP